MKKTILMLSLIFGIGASSLAQTNLLTNPGAEDNYDGWTKTDDGDGWLINLEELTPRSGDNFWVSSYEFCTLAQTIDLLSAGYTEGYLDATPDISAGAFVRSNIWCAALATIKVELCAADGSVISTHFVCDNLQITNSTDWEEKSLVISGYGSGVRKINFYLIGKDVPWWEGHFGTQYDDAYLNLTESPTTNIANASTKSITVSPNPASDFITLGEDSGLIRIYDMKGRMVFTHDARTNEHVNISSLQKGVYVLKIDSQNFKLVKK